MARELYNWDQNKGYSIIALCNVLENSGLDDEIKKIIINNFIREFDSLQTMYGKEGVIGLAQRYLKKSSMQYFIKNKYIFLNYTAISLFIIYFIATSIPKLDTEENKIYFKVLFIIPFILLIIYNILKNKEK